MWYWDNNRLMHSEYGDMGDSDFYDEEELRRKTGGLTPIPRVFIEAVEPKEE